MPLPAVTTANRGTEPLQKIPIQQRTTLPKRSGGPSHEALVGV